MEWSVPLSINWLIDRLTVPNFYKSLFLWHIWSLYLVRSPLFCPKSQNYGVGPQVWAVARLSQIKAFFLAASYNHFWRKAARVNYLLKVSAPSIVSTCNRILDGYTHVGGVNIWHLTEILHHNAKHNLQFRPSVQEMLAHLKMPIHIIKINIGMGYTACIFYF